MLAHQGEQQFAVPVKAKTKVVVSDRTGISYELSGVELGSGKYGKVQKAMNKLTGMAVAMKINDPIRVPADVREWEVKVLLRLRASGGNRSVVTMLDVVHSSDLNSHRIVMPLLGMTLSRLLTRDINIARVDVHPMEAKLEITRQLFDGLKYIHWIKIAHNDITMQNIMLDFEHGSVRFIDFGSSSDTSSETNMKTNVTQTLMDVYDLTRKIIIPFWTVTYFGATEDRAIKALSSRVEHHEHLEKAKSLLFMVQSVEMKALLNENLNFYDDLSAGEKAAIAELARLNFSLTNVTKRSVDFPADLHNILQEGLLLAPAANISSRRISAKLEELISNEDAIAGQRFIRDLAGTEEAYMGE
eukprot:scpid69289/ scgid25364/ Death-associated protein kinase 3; DAP-like kinase; MYPT1 kinase; ZIP-kinase